MSKVEVYTDGSCSPNPGSGGWGSVILVDGREIMKLAERSKWTTNQEMELVAAANSLHFIEFGMSEYFKDTIIIYTDSAYLCNCWKDGWWKKWVYNGWLNSKKDPVANRSCWENLIPYFKMPNITFVKVKGHVGNQYNEIADKLATGARLPN